MASAGVSKPPAVIIAWQLIKLFVKLALSIGYSVILLYLVTCFTSFVKTSKENFDCAKNMDLK